MLTMGARRYIIIHVARRYLFMKQQKGQQLKIRFFNDADHEKLKEIAERQDRSLTYLVNQAIKEFLKQQESAKA